MKIHVHVSPSLVNALPDKSLFSLHSLLQEKRCSLLLLPRLLLLCWRIFDLFIKYIMARNSNSTVAPLKKIQQWCSGWWVWDSIPTTKPDHWGWWRHKHGQQPKNNGWHHRVDHHQWPRSWHTSLRYLPVSFNQAIGGNHTIFYCYFCFLDNLQQRICWGLLCTFARGFWDCFG